MVTLLSSAGSTNYHNHSLPQRSDDPGHGGFTPTNTGSNASSGRRKALASQNLTFASTEIAPTWKGFLYTTLDALIVLEACLQDKLAYTIRRPHSRERSLLIDSGSVFVYKENDTGIKRWTDGGVWSPSRILGNFLVYRELSEPFPCGTSRKAKKRSHDAAFELISNHTSQSLEERKLVGSLIDAYGYKPGGLIKKTITIKYEGMNYHVVSYFKLEDVKQGLFDRPHVDPYLAGVWPRQGVLSSRFKVDPVDPIDDASSIKCFQDASNTPIPTSNIHSTWPQPTSVFSYPPVLTSSPSNDIASPCFERQDSANGNVPTAYGGRQVMPLSVDHADLMPSKRQDSIVSMTSMGESNHDDVPASSFSSMQSYESCFGMMPTQVYSLPYHPAHYANPWPACTAQRCDC